MLHPNQAKIPPEARGMPLQEWLNQRAQASRERAEKLVNSTEWYEIWKAQKWTKGEVPAYQKPAPVQEF